MYYLEIIAFVLFIMLMTLGYKKNSRNIMLVSSFCLLVGFAGPDFVRGFEKGYNETIKTKN